MSNTEKSKRNRSSVSRDYLDALEDFWGGRSRTTLEHVSNLLADKPDHVDNLALYRLWIEVLADEGNFSGLRSLGQHLDSLVAGQTRQKSSFFALQGIVHFELDEIEAAQLYGKSVAKEKDNPYAQELVFCLARRMGDDTQALSTAEKMSRSSCDFIQLQSALTFLYLQADPEQLKSGLKKMNSIFGGSPTLQYLALVDAFSEEEYATAYQCAVRLLDAFPSQSHYWFWAAYSLIKQSQSDKALPYLAKYIEIEGENDPDILAMIGHCYSDDYQNSGNEKARERAGYFLRRAQEILEAFGVDPVFVNRDFQSIRRKQPGNSQGKAWVYYLSGADFAGIHFSEEEKTKFLECSFGQETTVGDIVFVATRDPIAPKGEQRWKVGSIYTVASDTVGQSEKFFGKTLLELVGRPSVSLPLDINTLGFQEEEEKFDLYELDDAAVEVVIKSMEEFYGALPEGGRIFQELARFVSVS